MNALAEISVANAKLPAAYEAAKTALANCERLDECKGWSDKAAALASYARQADDDSLHRQAIRIQARAIRRCGELLKQFDGRGEHRRTEGAHPSSKDMSAAAGMSEHQHKQAVRVANVPAPDFEAAVEAPKPPTVTKLADMGRRPAPRPLIDLKGRDPAAFNRSLHFVADIEEYARELAEKNLGLILPGLVASERAEVRAAIAKIDAIHDQIITRI